MAKRTTKKDDLTGTEHLGNAETGQLRAIIERIENVDDEIAGLREGRKEIFAEAKGNGFDTKTIRWLIARRKKDADKLAEEEAMQDLYLKALGLA